MGLDCTTGKLGWRKIGLKNLDLLKVPKLIIINNVWKTSKAVEMKVFK